MEIGLLHEDKALFHVALLRSSRRPYIEGHLLRLPYDGVSQSLRGRSTPGSEHVRYLSVWRLTYAEDRDAVVVVCKLKSTCNFLGDKVYGSILQCDPWMKLRDLERLLIDFRS